MYGERFIQCCEFLHHNKIFAFSRRGCLYRCTGSQGLLLLFFSTPYPRVLLSPGADLSSPVGVLLLLAFLKTFAQNNTWSLLLLHRIHAASSYAVLCIYSLSHSLFFFYTVMCTDILKYINTRLYQKKLIFFLLL